MKKILWIIVAVLSGIYIVTPEFTDIIPIIGWLDEATALLVLNYALKKLNINLLDKLFGKKKNVGKTVIIEKEK